MLTRDTWYTAWPSEPAPEPADLAAVLADLAANLGAGRMTCADVATLTLAADDLLALAATLAPDPWPYLAARAAVGALPTGADACWPEPVA